MTPWETSNRIMAKGPTRYDIQQAIEEAIEAERAACEAVAMKVANSAARGEHEKTQKWEAQGLPAALMTLAIAEEIACKISLRQRGTR